MTWELWAIGGLVLLMAGIAIWAMRKTRSEFNSFNVNGPSIDQDQFAQKIAKATAHEMRIVLREFLEELKKIPMSQVTYKREEYVDQIRSQISMDESIIPVDLQVDVEATNLEGATTAEKVVDKDLDKSKSKLAGLLKNRKKE